MPIASSVLAQDPWFLQTFSRGARALLQIYDESPRLGALFSSQQRWLMCHAAFALTCSSDQDDPASGLYSARFSDLVVAKQVASRNTAADFLKELLRYGFVQELDENVDRRRKRLSPTPMVEQAMSQWLDLHLSVLDGLDGGSRAAHYRSEPDMMYRLQPRIAARVLDDRGVRHQGPAFDLFTWANAGGLVLDLLIASIDPAFDIAAPDATQIPSCRTSISELSRRFMISRTHAKRLFDKVAEMGDIGWTGGRGENDIWISRRLLRQYWQYQADKYAIVDDAFAETIGSN